ncbi:hypothetical protein LCGC14_2289020 [marine sediment metagenome]|uniref:Branched-chain-amino-acid aminotransferase n=1 Tax=marine sediment metagenome TaxID=412755 RepID=A0A0F9F4A8_9ZZZZ
MEKPFRAALIAPPGLQIIETLRHDAGEGPVRGDLHLERLRRTCARLGFAYSGDAVMAALSRVPRDTVRRVRLTVDAAGRVAMTSTPLGANAALWRVALSPVRLSSQDPWLALKTTQRAIYDTARASLPRGLDERVFLNERDELCEGTITNLFLVRDGTLLTPAAQSGLLPGVLRASLLAEGRAREAVLTLRDLRAATARNGLFMGNSARGLIRASLIG